MPSTLSLFITLLVSASAVLLQVHAAPGAKTNHNHLTPSMARAILIAGMEHEMDDVATAVRFLVGCVGGWRLRDVLCVWVYACFSLA